MNRLALRNQFMTLVNRTDLPDSLADTFIDLGIRKLERILRVPSMERAYTYIASGTTSDFPIPNDFLELIGVACNGVRLTRVSGSEGIQKYGAQVYWRYGNVLRLSPMPAAGASIEIMYFAEFEAPGADTYETVEMAIMPDALIYAGLLYAADHYIDDRLPAWTARLDSIISEIQGSAERDEFAGRDLRIASPHAGDY